MAIFNSYVSLPEGNWVFNPNQKLTSHWCDDRIDGDPDIPQPGRAGPVVILSSCFLIAESLVKPVEGDGMRMLPWWEAKDVALCRKIPSGYLT
jgi:hypothetical protein